MHVPDRILVAGKILLILMKCNMKELLRWEVCYTNVEWIIKNAFKETSYYLTIYQNI
jgi:hypothetical protein